MNEPYLTIALAIRKTLEFYKPCAEKTGGFYALKGIEGLVMMIANGLNGQEGFDYRLFMKTTGIND